MYRYRQGQDGSIHPDDEILPGDPVDERAASWAKAQEQYPELFQWCDSVAFLEQNAPNLPALRKLRLPRQEDVRLGVELVAWAYSPGPDGAMIAGGFPFVIEGIEGDMICLRNSDAGRRQVQVSYILGKKFRAGDYLYLVHI